MGTDAVKDFRVCRRQMWSTGLGQGRQLEAGLTQTWMQLCGAGQGWVECD